MDLNTYPTSPEDEVAIIGCCLQGGLETALAAVETVPLDAFCDPDALEMFRLIEQMATEGREITPYSVAYKWRESSKAKLPMQLLQAEGLPSMLAQHRDRVVDLWRKRRLFTNCYAALEKGQVKGVGADQIIGDLEKAMAGEGIAITSTFNGRQCSDRLVDDLERRFKLGGALSGIGTGFHNFDRLSDGIQFGDQTIIAARPSMGKTALGIGVILHACFKHRVPTLFVSLEMSVEAIMRRMCSAWSEIPMNEIRRGSYTPDQFKAFTTFRAFASKAPIWITDAISGIGINELCAVIRRRVRKDGVKLVVIDYLQKIRPAQKQEKKTYEVGDVSSALRALAVSTKSAFLTLAQLNRESEREKGRLPRLSDLGDSKQIEQDADTVALIHRKRDDQTGAANLIVAKQRDGDIGICPILFNGTYCRFENTSPIA